MQCAKPLDSACFTRDIWHFAEASFNVMGHSDAELNVEALFVYDALGMAQPQKETHYHNFFTGSETTTLSSQDKAHFQRKWDVIKEFYAFMRPKVIEAYTNGEQIFLHKDTDTCAPNTWELKPTAFIRLCYTHGIYIRPQMQQLLPANEVQAMIEKDRQPIGVVGKIVRQVKTITVVVTERGFDDHLREVGDVFDVPVHVVGSWIKPVSEVDMSLYAKPEPRVTDHPNLITKDNFEEIADRLRFYSTEEIVDWCYLMVGYEMHSPPPDLNGEINARGQRIVAPHSHNIPAYLDWDSRVAELHAEALEAAKNGELACEYHSHLPYATMTTFAHFLHWYVVKTQKPILPIVKQLLEKAAGYRATHEDCYILDEKPIIFTSEEGETQECLAWWEWAQKYDEPTKPCSIGYAACLMHSINPITQMTLVLDCFPEEVRIALQSLEEEAEAIRTTYHSLRQYCIEKLCKPDFTAYQVELYLDLVKVRDVHEWLAKENKTLPESLARTIKMVNEEMQKLRTDGLYFTNQCILYEGKPVASVLLERRNEWRLAEACFIVMGKVEQPTGDTIFVHQPKTEEYYYHFSEGTTLTPYIEEISRCERKWQTIKHFYHHMRPKIVDAHNKGVGIFLHKNTDTQTPYTWQLIPAEFIRLCHEAGVHIRPQLRGFLTEEQRRKYVGGADNVQSKQVNILSAPERYKKARRLLQENRLTDNQKNRLQVKLLLIEQGLMHGSVGDAAFLSGWRKHNPSAQTKRIAESLHNR